MHHDTSTPTPKTTRSGSKSQRVKLGSHDPRRRNRQAPPGSNLSASVTAGVDAMLLREMFPKRRTEQRETAKKGRARARGEFQKYLGGGRLLGETGSSSPLERVSSLRDGGVPRGLPGSRRRDVSPAGWKIAGLEDAGRGVADDEQVPKNGRPQRGTRGRGKETTRNKRSLE